MILNFKINKWITGALEPTLKFCAKVYNIEIYKTFVYTQLYFFTISPFS
jgi:hypothetical protein